MIVGRTCENPAKFRRFDFLQGICGLSTRYGQVELYRML